MISYWQAHTYLGSDMSDQIALANKIAGIKPTKFSTWAQVNFQRDAGAPASAAGAVTPERIQARAYEIFLARNSGDGDALADWLQAERELTGSGLPADEAGIDVKVRRWASSSSAESQRRKS